MEIALSIAQTHRRSPASCRSARGLKAAMSLSTMALAAPRIDHFRSESHKMPRDVPYIIASFLSDNASTTITPLVSMRWEHSLLALACVLVLCFGELLSCGFGISGGDRVLGGRAGTRECLESGDSCPRSWKMGTTIPLRSCSLELPVLVLIATASMAAPCLQRPGPLLCGEKSNTFYGPQPLHQAHESQGTIELGLRSVVLALHLRGGGKSDKKSVRASASASEHPTQEPGEIDADRPPEDIIPTDEISVGSQEDVWLNPDYYGTSVCLQRLTTAHTSPAPPRQTPALRL